MAYQRKVMTTLTRAEAGLVADVMMKVATDQLVRQALGWSPVEVRRIRRAKNAWKKFDRRITRRDEAQRAKENVGTLPLRGGAKIGSAFQPGDDEIEVPLEGL